MPTENGAPTGAEIVEGIRRDEARDRDRRAAKRAEKLHKLRSRWQQAQADADQAHAELVSARTRAECLAKREILAERTFRGYRTIQECQPGDVVVCLSGPALGQVRVAFLYETVEGWSGHVWNESAKRFDTRVSSFSYGHVAERTGHSVRIRRRGKGGKTEAAPLFVPGQRGGSEAA